jgi:predicted enzyme related to lactoylglutathione lyase
MEVKYRSKRRFHFLDPAGKELAVWSVQLWVLGGCA